MFLGLEIPWNKGYFKKRLEVWRESGKYYNLYFKNAFVSFSLACPFSGTQKPCFSDNDF